MLDKVQRVVPWRAAAEATARQSTRASTATVGVNDPCYKSPIMDHGESALWSTGSCRSTRVDREAVWLFPLRPEIYSHRVRAGLGSSFTHLVQEASLASGAGGVVIRPIVRRCRDHNSIAVDVYVGRSRSTPFETRCIYCPHLFPPGAERDRSRCRCRSSRSRRGCRRRWCAAGYSGQDIDP